MLRILKTTLFLLILASIVDAQPNRVSGSASDPDSLVLGPYAGASRVSVNLIGSIRIGGVTNAMPIDTVTIVGDTAKVWIKKADGTTVGYNMFAPGAAPGAAGGETNTFSTLGTGTYSVVGTKSGADLQFKELLAGSNISLATNSTSVTITSTGGGGSGDSSFVTVQIDSFLTFNADTFVFANDAQFDSTVTFLMGAIISSGDLNIGINALVYGTGSLSNSDLEILDDGAIVSSEITDDTIVPADLNDAADIPGTTDYLRISSGDATQFEYRNTAEVLSDIGAAAASHNHAANEITSGTLLHERGGLETDVSAYNGLIRISGGSTTNITNLSGLNTALGSSIADGAHVTNYVTDNADDNVAGDLTLDDDDAGTALVIRVDAPGAAAGTPNVGILITTDDNDDGDYDPFEIRDDSGGGNDLLFFIDHQGLITTASVNSASIVNGAVVNEDINSSAGIVYTKLSFSDNIVASDIAADAINTTELDDAADTPSANQLVQVATATSDFEYVDIADRIIAGTNLSESGTTTLTLNVDDAFILNTGDVGTGDYDFGGASSFELPNDAAPTVNAFGEVAGDNDAWASGRGTIILYDGTASAFVVATQTSDTPTNGQVPKWNTGGIISWENDATGGGGSATADSAATDHGNKDFDAFWPDRFSTFHIDSIFSLDSLHIVIGASPAGSVIFSDTINIGTNPITFSTGQLSPTDLELLDDGVITLSTETSGNYVQDVADGTGIDGTASGAGTTYTPTLDLTEISSLTWGAGSFTTMTFDAGAVDPVITASSGVLNISTGALQVGGSAVLTTEADPIVGAVNGLVKADGGGSISAATANTDYEPALTDEASLYSTLSDVSLFLEDLADDTTPQLGGALDGQGNDLNNLGVVFLTEQADAEADAAGKGQFWVNTATPNEPYFTDDAGNDGLLLRDSDIGTIILAPDGDGSGLSGIITSESDPIITNLFNAQTVLTAVADNTPAALTLTEQTVLGRLTGGNIAAITLGILDNNVVQIDGSPNSGEYARFTASGIEGRTGAEFKTDFNLEIGTDIQAYDADLDTWAGITPGTGVGTALAVNVGSAGAFVVFNGAGGTPSSLTLTNGLGLPVPTGLTGLADGEFVVGDGVGAPASESGRTARISMGVDIPSLTSATPVISDSTWIWDNDVNDVRRVALSDIEAIFSLDNLAGNVALGTQTTGNYVASITNGTGITGGNGGSEGAALTLAATLGTDITRSELNADVVLTDTASITLYFHAFDTTATPGALTFTNFGAFDAWVFSSNTLDSLINKTPEIIPEQFVSWVAWQAFYVGGGTTADTLIVMSKAYAHDEAPTTTLAYTWRDTLLATSTANGDRIKGTRLTSFNNGIAAGDVAHFAIVRPANDADALDADAGIEMYYVRKENIQ